MQINKYSFLRFKSVHVIISILHTGSGNLTAAAQRLKDHDVHVVSVGLGNQTNIEELKNIANHAGSVFLVKDYGAIANYVDELAAEICEGKF